jgi:hypothetical protein
MISRAPLGACLKMLTGHHLDQLLREGRVGRDRRRHRDVDERARHRQCPLRRSFTSAGMSSIRSATEMPAALHDLLCLAEWSVRSIDPD